MLNANRTEIKKITIIVLYAYLERNCKSMFQKKILNIKKKTAFKKTVNIKNTVNIKKKQYLNHIFLILCYFILNVVYVLDSLYIKILIKMFFSRYFYNLFDGQKNIKNHQCALSFFLILHKHLYNYYSLRFRQD